MGGGCIFVVEELRMRFAVLVCVLVASCFVEAGGRKRRVPMAVEQTRVVTATPNSFTSVTTTKATPTTGSDDALAEVNRQRAARGLRPYVNDPLLNAAARACAAFRAAHWIHGHTNSDFAFLPPGAHATSAGCAALEPSWGFAACCVYDNYTYAGAAWVMGSDGRRYNHIFVR